VTRKVSEQRRGRTSRLLSMSRVSSSRHLSQRPTRLLKSDGFLIGMSGLHQVAISEVAGDRNEIEIAGEISKPFPFPIICGACFTALEFRFERSRFRYVHPRRAVTNCAIGIRYTIWPEHIAELCFKTIAAQRPPESGLRVADRLFRWTEHVVVLREQIGPSPIEARDHYFVVLKDVPSS
jgi:hypothetical protein